MRSTNENSAKRVGLLGIYHESNTFIDQNTSMIDFENGHLFFDKHIISEYQEAFHEIGGIIEVFDEHSFELIPIFYAEATPGGIINEATSRALLAQLTKALDRHLPLDGLLVVPHGAAVSQIDDDFDGYWITLLRKHLGKIPIIGTLDPHANISARMSENVDALIAYKTNPHLDQRQTGNRAAKLMIETLTGRTRPFQKMLPAPLAISIEQQLTDAEPCLGLYQLTEKLEKKSGVISISILLGFPYADVIDMGSAILVITNNDEALANHILKEINEYFYLYYHRFSGEKTSINQAINAIKNSLKPILLLDMGDNVGGGSPGDGTFLLNALEKEKHCKSFICINDPNAIEILRDLEIDEFVELDLGAKTDHNHGVPLRTLIQIKKRISGVFFDEEACHGGQLNYDMGPTALVETQENTTIMITSKRTAPFSLQQLLHCGINPVDFDAIVAKGVQAPIAAYKSICPTIIRVNTRGVTNADMRQLRYENRRKPLFPFEEINGEQ